MTKEDLIKDVKKNLGGRISKEAIDYIVICLEAMHIIGGRDEIKERMDK